MEVYGNETPTKNGEPLDWLDTSLLRHAMDAEDGFLTIYVNAEGKTVFRSTAPISTSDLHDHVGLVKPRGGPGGKKSLVLKKLQAA